MRSYPTFVMMSEEPVRRLEILRREDYWEDMTDVAGQGDMLADMLGVMCACGSFRAVLLDPHASVPPHDPALDPYLAYAYAYAFSPFYPVPSSVPLLPPPDDVWVCDESRAECLLVDAVHPTMLPDLLFLGAEGQYTGCAPAHLRGAWALHELTTSVRPPRGYEVVG